jgi:EAL domain-containing protein (putative c-di-GMP-specific phosphodiesterase class I)/GGDEF domain-containing protein
MREEQQIDPFVLTTEWLRFKSNLYDKNTNLPTLPMVVDEIRRMVEEFGTAGLVLVDLGRQENLEAMFGWQIYDEIIRDFADILTSTRAEILRKKDIVSVLQVKGDEFLIIMSPQPGKPWNEANLEVMNERLRNAIRKKMEPLSSQRWHSHLTFYTGYASIVRDPAVRIERLIQRAIARAREVSGQEIENEKIRHHIALQRILCNKSIVTYFQPIVYLDGLQVLGYEALSRGPADCGFEGSELLFAFAESTNMLLDLERLCRATALRAAQGNGIDRNLFLNFSAKALQDSHMTPAQLSESVTDLGLNQEHIVLEITERIAIQHWESFRKILHQYRDCGFKVAIDDMGAGYSSLQSIAELEPDYLKFDISLVSNIHENLIKIGLLETLVALSSKINAKVIAEGIESREDYLALRSLGVQLGQGYFFASPSPHLPAVTAHAAD